MKKSIFLMFLLLSFGSLQMQAQQGPPPKRDGGRGGDRVESMRVAFITDRLNLTPEEAQRFWPIYNQMNNDVKTLRRNFKVENNPSGEMTADERLDFEQKRLDIKKKYKPQFEAAIGKEKVNKLVSLEEDFKHQLMQMMRDRRDGEGARPNGR